MTTAQRFAHWCQQLASALAQAELDLWAPVPVTTDPRHAASERSSH